MSPARRAFAAVLAALAASHLALAASAQDVADPVEAADAEVAEAPRVMRVAVIIVPVGGVDGETAEALTELLIAHVADRARGEGEGVQIVGREELQAHLGADDAGTATCIESIACLGRVGVQLGVREVIAGTIARHDGAWVFVLSRSDVRTGEALGRVFREVQGDALGGLIDALADAVPELWTVVARTGALEIAASVAGAEIEIDGAVVGTVAEVGVPLTRGEVEPGRHVIRASAPGHLPWERTVDVAAGATLVLDAVMERAPIAPPTETLSPVVWIGGGVALAALAGGLALGTLSVASAGDALDMRQTYAFYADREVEASLANVLFGVAGAGAIAAFVGLFFPERSAPAEHAVRVEPTLGGLVIRGALR